MSIWLTDYHDSNFRILFQNADNTINMVRVCEFHHDVPQSKNEFEDLAWYRMLADIMLNTYKNVQDSSTGKLISLGEDMRGFGYMSCYVELHRPDFISCISYGPWVSNEITLNACEIIKSHPVGSNGQNYILAHTPLKFLPVVEFEKRQKSIQMKQWVPKELMAPPKASKPATKPKSKTKKNKKRNK